MKTNISGSFSIGLFWKKHEDEKRIVFMVKIVQIMIVKDGNTSDIGNPNFPRSVWSSLFHLYREKGLLLFWLILRLHQILTPILIFRFHNYHI